MEQNNLVQYLQSYVLKCTICLETLKTPKSLPCQHVFCQKCIESHINENAEKGFYNCPECQEKHQFTDGQGVACLRIAVVQKSLLEALDLMQKKPIICTSCENQNKAEVACSACDDFLCTECESSHKRIRLTRKHTPTPIEELADKQKLALFQQGRFNPCDRHPLQMCTLSCKTDNLQICQTCATHCTHEGHDIVPIEIELDALKSNIARHEREREELENLVQKSKTFAEARIATIKETEENDITLLKKRTKDLQKLVKNYEKEIRSIIQSQSKREQRLYETHMQECDMWMEKQCRIMDTKVILDVLPPPSALKLASDMTECLEKARQLSSIVTQGCSQGYLFKNVPKNGIREALQRFVGEPQENRQNTCFQSTEKTKHNTHDKPEIQNAADLHGAKSKEPGIDIFVKTLSGRTHTLKVHRDTKVAHLKNIIKSKLDCPIERQSLMSGGQWLKNKHSLVDYNIQHETTLYLSSH